MTKLSRCRIKEHVNFIGKQRKLLKKFKDTKSFNNTETMSQSKSIIYFRLGLNKFLKKFLALTKSTL